MFDPFEEVYDYDFDNVDYASLTPAEWIEEVTGKEATCDKCNERLVEVGYYSPDVSDDGLYFCDACMSSFVSDLRMEAEAFADENCRITRALPFYMPDLEYRCTPEEYAEGAMESYTKNSFLCHCRHNCTNYDELIKEYVKNGGTRDRVFYWEIRIWIDNMIRREIEEKDLIRYSDEVEDDEE